MCDLSEVGSILGGSSHRRSRPAVMQMRPLRGLWGTFHGASAPFNGGEAALNAPQGQYLLAQGSALGDGAPQVAPCRSALPLS